MVSPALSRRARLLAPVLAVGVVAAGATLPRLADATDASTSLPARSATDLLEAVSNASVDGLSGTVVATSRLGLPELPGPDSGGSAVSLPGLLAGSTTARVWKAGDDRSRVAVHAPFAEYDVVHDGDGVWTWDSASREVTHLDLPEHQEHQASPAPVPSAGATPQDLADALLSTLDPTTQVTVGSAEQVAGRPAYELVLEPREQVGTLVDAVRIAVDGETSVPLRVQVFGVGQPEAAVEVGFTSVSFEVPDASVFAFAPPAGATVTERSLDAPSAPQEAPEAETAPSTSPQVLGSGWATVVRMSGVELPDETAQLVSQLSTPVEGGRVVTSALVSVLLLDDGQVLLGAVPVDRLRELAGS